MTEAPGPRRTIVDNRFRTGHVPQGLRLSLATSVQDRNMAETGKEMTFLEHLEELRWTLVRSAIAVVCGMIVVFIYSDWIMDRVVLGPARSDFITYKFFCMMGRRSGLGDALCLGDRALTFQSQELSGQFMMAFTIAFTFGLVLASPVVIWQFWRFIGPGLKERERKAVRGMVGGVVVLFLIGVAFAYWVVAPLSVQFFTTFSLSSSITNIPTIQNYVSMLTSFVLWTGVAFELPVITVLLTRLGLLGPEFLRKYRKHAYIAILIVAAIITPPDVTSQILVTLPLVVLYEFSIFMASRTRKRQERKASTSAAPAR